ncbi:DMT family transporter [Paenibacillus albiflavus]|uniref:DMT family transporter n=1 Tax=Paenibacillus albiflavus TaxID=2545760 RepID=A0A4R4E783_9BACL|nr:DMT family transporter [Paenibacillus albiflavus]TCZ75399.1 DMT family transporter [Paenibacillus albiflavus]
MRKYAGEIGLLLVAIIWGSGFVASAVSLESLSPYQVMAIRFLIAALLMSAIFMKYFKALKRSTIGAGVVLGVILFLAFTLQTVGLQYTTPSKNAFLTAVNVVIVPFIGFVLYRRKLDKYGLIGALLAVIGVGILSLQFNFSLNIGDVLTILCAVCFAFHIFFTSEFVKRHHPVEITIIQMIVAFLLSLLVVVLRGEPVLPVNMDSKGIMAAVYLGIFSTTIAFLLQTIAQKYTSETKAAIILSTEALFGTLFSIIILSEVLTLRMVIGSILILVAIITAETKLKFIQNKMSRRYYGDN